MLPKSLQLWPWGAASFSHTSSFPERPPHRRTLRGRLIVSVPRRRHFPRARAPAVGARGFAAKVGPALAAPGAAFVRPSALGEACAHAAHASVTRPSVRLSSIYHLSVYLSSLSVY